MSKCRVYVAGPLTGQRNTNKGYDYSQICVNVRKAIDVGAWLMQYGFAPYVPHLTHFWNLFHLHTWEDWMDHDEVWVAQCEAVLRLPGESAGADRECAYAKGLGIPVFETVEALVKWRDERNVETLQPVRQAGDVEGQHTAGT